VCPSQALFFGTSEEIERLRPRSTPANRFLFGEQTITTKVNLMVPRQAHVAFIDVTASMHESVKDKMLSLDLMDSSLFEPDEVE
jgi:hypothetical protein